MSRHQLSDRRSELLTKATLATAARSLAQRDRTLAVIHSRFGDPPLWRRASGFATLVHIILEQQVSLKSGRAMFDRLNRAIQPFTPERFGALGVDYLRRLGVTRQKSSYLIDLASAIRTDKVNFRRLVTLSDNNARIMLMNVKGIGSWSADVYLLMAMRRADVWPAGDLALAIAAHELYGLEERPNADALEKMAEQWRPYRAVAARMLWQYYLGRKGKVSTNEPPT